MPTLHKTVKEVGIALIPLTNINMKNQRKQLAAFKTRGLFLQGPEL
jgi:hypothetical protein